MLSGHCLCEAVRFTVLAPFEYAGFCHCPRCRLATGSAFSAFAAVRRQNLSIDRGALALAVYERSADNFSRFCSSCGSLLFAIVRNGAYAHVQLGALVDDPGIRPQCHIFVGAKAPWFEIGDGLPCFLTVPDW